MAGVGVNERATDMTHRLSHSDAIECSPVGNVFHPLNRLSPHIMSAVPISAVVPYSTVYKYEKPTGRAGMPKGSCEFYKQDYILAINY